MEETLINHRKAKNDGLLAVLSMLGEISNGSAERQSMTCPRRLAKLSIAAITVAILLSGCERKASRPEEYPTLPPLLETASLGELPTIPDVTIDTIIHGDAQEAAEVLLEVTLDERSALACVPLLLPRLHECGESMDQAILTREDRQPAWMRLRNNRIYYSIGHPERAEQILRRLTDCVREATPSVERANTRQLFLDAMNTDASESRDYQREIAYRVVIFPGDVKTETGWEDLFRAFDRRIAVGATSGGLLESLRGTCLNYCAQYPDKESWVLEEYTDFVNDRFFEFLEARKRSPWAPPPWCYERYYRTLLVRSPQELVEIFASKQHYGATRTIAGLITDTRQARLDSFPLVKPYLETFRENRQSFDHWLDVFSGYCVPVAADAIDEELDRQHWLIEELTQQLETNQGGYLETKTNPESLLGFLIIRSDDPDDIRRAKDVPDPYGKAEIIALLLKQSASNNEFRSDCAFRKLNSLCWFDAATANLIIEELLKPREGIAVNGKYLDRRDDVVAEAKRALAHF